MSDLTTDNRDLHAIEEYLRARIEVLTKRIAELEDEVMAASAHDKC